MKTKIIGFSGKIGAGKTTAAKLLHAIAFQSLIRDKDGNLLTPRSYIDQDGKLMVGISPDEDQELNIDSRNLEVMDWLAENVWPYIRKFSCAEPLKNFCVDILGLNPDHVWGSQKDKNQPTHLKWENMPVELWHHPQNPNALLHNTENYSNLIKKTGYMTVREVQEYFGTEIIRKMNPDGWANGLIKLIEAYSPLIAVVDDIRFENEVLAIKNAGGVVIRLTLTTEEAKKNNHLSNVALDNYNSFNKVIDNQKLTMEETFSQIVGYLSEIGWLEVKREVDEDGN